MTGDLVGLIDADFIKYLVSYDIERMFKKGLKPDAVLPYNTIADLSEKRIQKIMDQTASKAKDYLFLFSGKTKDNHRSKIACVKKYKGTRVYKQKFPKEGEYRCMVEQYIQENYNYHKEPELEADDLCVMGHTEGTFIYSHDKDLKMSPGLHYDIKEEKFFETSKETGFKILMAQVLSGDGVDNIMGVDGVGKVNAVKIINRATGDRDVIKKVIDTYTKKYGMKDGLDRFVEMYTLINLKTDRGEYTKEKYSEFFKKLEELKNKKPDQLDFFS